MTTKKLSKNKTIAILIGVLFSLLLVSLDSTIVSTAMPKIIASLNGMNYYAWPFTAFMLTMTISIPIFGKLSDIYGFKMIYTIGIAIFLIGSIMCGASGNMFQLIIFRGIQGVGAGVIVSNTMGLIGVLFPPSERAKFMGIASSVGAIASVIGPSLGGFITDHFNWHWIFYVNIPVGLIAMLLVLLTLPSNLDETERIKKKKIDYIGALTLILGLVPMLLAFTWGGKDYKWSSAIIISMLAFSVFMLILFVVIEKYAEDPIVPLSFFKNSAFNVSIVVMFFVNGSMMGAAIFVPLFAQSVIAKSATSSGIVTTPMMLGLVVGAIISGQLVAKTGKYKLISIVGLIILAVGNFLLSLMNIKTSNSTIAFNMVITGFGVGVVMPIFSVAVQNLFPKNQMGAVSSAVQFFSKMGATMASSILGTIMLTSMNTKLKSIDISHLPAKLQQLLQKTNGLSDSSSLAKVKAMLPRNLENAFYSLINQVRQIEGKSIQQIFVLCIFAVAVAIGTALFLKESLLMKEA